MRTQLGRLDRRTRTALGGPGLAVVAVAALLVFGAVVVVQTADPGATAVVAVLALVALVINLAGARRRSRQR
ncbi:hypothetical protein HQ325_04880 [Rhodococcus sp. BP-349]|uniref:hypothetical protein n=1 Tax=unclassified Rhodococcus (in: high G+C Gram-positive bacteria) TaxID=192944 RepID=UPI001C9AE644|nr:MULTISPECIES: hypothetical protein [unclassified Rhodococcus (in: high G+C Gram-positive bacteria)]MBY6538001.1 hypothetical protein [Rhodococcus sp. BP-363]MBY6542338.1 hypothetical protein [Rhodococcus sp. BP-369]MBY6561568.1 hypothetical protein [Rhodococcus sp. BP-370]MBY6575860.1 hypothetical protein [Rhodococcus sp. BP-364]MBY6585161.1 hypothetical protein [Rhodococcus sp. BP-358]